MPKMCLSWWCFLVSYRFRVTDPKNWLKQPKSSTKICFGGEWSLNIKISKCHCKTIEHLLNLRSCQVSWKLVMRKWPKQWICHRKTLVFCSLLWAPLAKKILRVCLSPSLSLCQVLSKSVQYLKRYTENVFQHHYNVGVKPVYASRQQLFCSHWYKIMNWTSQINCSLKVK